MSKQEIKESTLGRVFGWLIGAIIGFIIFVLIMEWLGASGYAEKLLLKMLKEIPYGPFIGKWAAAIMKNILGTAQDMWFYDTEPMTFTSFMLDLFKLIISGLIFKGLVSLMEFFTRLEKQTLCKDLIIRGIIRFICAMISTAISTFASSGLKNVIKIGESGIWKWMNEGEQIKLGLLLMAMLAITVLLIVFGTYAIYKTITLAIFLWHVIGKMLVVNIVSILFAYVFSFIVVEGIALRLPPKSMLVYLILILILIVLMTWIDRVVDFLSPIKK